MYIGLYVKILLIQIFRTISIMECFNNYSEKAFRKVTGAHRYRITLLLKFRNLHLMNLVYLIVLGWETYDRSDRNLNLIRILT